MTGEPGPRGGERDAPAPIRIELPTHLAKMAGTGPEVEVAVESMPAEGSGTDPAGDPLPPETYPPPITYRALFDALEARLPMLRGTIRDPRSGERRPYMRYFAERRDLSHEDPDSALPDAVARGREVLRIVGAIAGG